jgi:endoglucanase
MKTLSLLLTVALWCMLGATCFAAEGEKSLLPAGKFDQEKGEEPPKGWKLPEGGTWEKEGEGHFIKLVSSKPGANVMIYQAVKLPKELPPALELRLKVRYSEIKPGKEKWFDGRVMMNFKDKDGKKVKPDPSAPYFRGSSEGWVDRSVFFKIPEGATTLEIMPCLFQAASGTLEFQRIELLPAKAEQVPPPKVSAAPAPSVPSTTMVPPEGAPLPSELKVSGNMIVAADGKQVWLQGLSLDSMQWNPGGDKILQSIPVAMEQWKANVIRLAVKEEFWFGRGQYQKDGGKGYKELVDAAVNATAARGGYLVLDLHRFGSPNDKHVEFWKDAAMRYKNHPGVLFELFNEPHGISWKIWRDGGDLKSAENVKVDVNVVENNEKQDEHKSVGMQALVDAVRGTGAKNIVIAGGVDWSYNLSGVLKGYALTEREGGNGIVYSSHIYPWKKGWQAAMLDVAAVHPIFMGEVGCPEKWEDFSFISPKERYEELGPNCKWPADMLGTIQKHKLNWTGFSFHPKCGPMVISDWQYTPTPYWGVYVKDALAGKTFEVQRIR